MRLGVDPKIDFAFKRVFGSEANTDILIDVVNSVLRLPPSERVVEVRILNPFSEKDALDDKLSILDIKARDQLGRQFNVEMQMAARQSLPARVLYYWAKLYEEQLHEGEDYEELCPTITICFLNDEFFLTTTDHHLRFQLVDRKHDLVLSDQLDLHLIELPKFKRSLDELGEPVDQWLYFLRYAEDLDPDDLPSSLDRPTIHHAAEELRMLTENELLRQRYEAREKARRDALWVERDHRRRLEEVQAQLEEAQTRAEEAQAKVEGARESGLHKGELIGRIHLCQRVLKQSCSPMHELEGLGLDDLEALANQLESKLPG